MLPSSTAAEPVNVEVKFPILYDENGSKINTGGPLSGFDFMINGIEEVVYGTYTPASGSLIDDNLNVSDIQFGLSYDLLESYDGFKFTYTLADADKTYTVTVPASEVDKTSPVEGSDSVVYTFAAPKEAIVASSATVTLDNPVWADGYTNVSSATYGYQFQAQVYQPGALAGADMNDEESEAKLEKLATETSEGAGDGDMIIVQNTAPEQIGVMRFMIYDVTTSEYVLTETSFTKVEDEDEPDASYFKWQNADPADYLFYDTDTYRLEVYAAIDTKSADKHQWVGQGYFYFKGTTPPYEYAEYTFVSVSPDPDDHVIESTDENTFTVTFDGPVKIDKDNSYVQLNTEGGTYPFENIESSDGEEYSKVWTLTVYSSTMEAVNDGLNLTVAAVGENGGRVTGDSEYFQGSEAGRYLLFSYNASFNVADVEVSPADGSTLDKIDVIYASYYGDGGINFAYIANDKDVKLYDANGNEVAYVKNAEAIWPDNYDDPFTTIKMPLSKTITTPGVYTLVIPYGYLVLGEDMYAVNNKKTTVTYTIPEKVSVEVGETGYATLYYSDKALTVPEDIDAWTYAASGSALTANQSYPAGSVIPAGEAVVLRTHEPGTYEFTVSSTDASKVADNALKGTDEEKEVTAADGNKLYVLGVGNEGIGFYQASADGKSFTNGAHKAYLEVSADADAKFFSIDGTATGINDIANNAESNDNIYNMQGQKMQNMNRRGLYIVGGKKVVVK